MNSAKLKFCRFLYESESLASFEQWLYATPELEAVLGKEDYLALLSLDFSQKVIRHEIDKLLSQHISDGEYETWRLQKMLADLLEGEGIPVYELCEFYELYCRGLSFLETLGLEYGLPIKVPPAGYSSDYFDELSDEEQERLLADCLPGAKEEARKVLNLLESGGVAIAPETDDLGNYRYIDHR